jgi:hypothetical protein
MPTNETLVESGRIGVVQLTSSVSEVERSDYPTI